MTITTALPATARSHSKTYRKITMPAWTRHLHLLSTGLLMLAVVALSFAAFGPNGIGGGDGNGTGDGPGFYAAVPVATVPDDAVNSSIPYPTAEECTVEPMTREGLIQHYRDASAASGDAPFQGLDLNEPGTDPSEEEADAIMQAYREWQACGLEGKGPLYHLQLETPLFTANQSDLFYDHRPPVSDEIIEEWADFILSGEPLYPPVAPTPEITAALTGDNPASTPTPDIDGIVSTPAMPVGPAATPIVIEITPGGAPLPHDATPVIDPPTGRPEPTIFPEDIAMFGTDHAMAQAYFVDPVTREVVVISPLTFWFEKIDGQWKVDFYSEGGGA